MYEQFKQILEELVAMRQETAAKEVLRGALLVTGDKDQRAILSSIIKTTQTVYSGNVIGGINQRGVGDKVYNVITSIDPNLEKKTGALIAGQVLRGRADRGVVVGDRTDHMGDSIGTSRVITFKGTSGIELEKPYQASDEIPYNEGGELNEGIESLNDDEDIDIDGVDGVGIGVDSNGEKFDVVDGDQTELLKMVAQSKNAIRPSRRDSRDRR